MTYENYPEGYKHCFMCGRVKEDGFFLGVVCRNPYASGVQPDGKRYFCDICRATHSNRTILIVADSVDGVQE